MPVGGVEGTIITALSPVLGTITVALVGAGAIDGEFKGIGADVPVPCSLVSPVAGA
jgi:hypothetical protein